MKKLLLIIPVLCGCSLLKFPVLNAPNPPQTVYKYDQSFKTSPQVIQTPDGKAYVWEEKTQTVTAGYDNKEKPLSFWQRFTNWLAGWSLITVLVVGGCMAFGFTAPVLFLYKRYKTFRESLKTVVKSIDASKVLEEHSQLKSELKTNLDTNEKKVIDDLKRE